MEFPSTSSGSGSGIPSASSSSDLLPRWRKYVGPPETLRLDFSPAARAEQEKRKQPGRLLPSEIQHMAKGEVRRLGGDVSNEQHVLGQHTFQFSKYKGKSFVWALSNDAGYCAWLVANIEIKEEKEDPQDPCSFNKFRLREYMRSFPEGRQLISRKKTEYLVGPRWKPSLSSSSSRAAASVPATSATVKGPSTSSGGGDGQGPTHSTAEQRRGKTLPASAVGPPLASRVGEGTSASKGKGKKTKVPASVTSTPALAGEGQVGTSPDTGHHPTFPLAGGQVGTSTSTGHPCKSGDDFPLPAGWRADMAEQDHKWVSNALFKWSDKGKPQLDETRLDHIWFSPPSPPRRPHLQKPPKSGPYFTHRLCVWMPRKIWKYSFRCPKEACGGCNLVSAGLYRNVRRVLDVNDFYYLAGEYLQCPRCTGKLISWSLPLLRQMDLPFRSEFPAILTYHLACDMKVVEFLKQRRLGNSPMQLQKTLEEQHTKHHMIRVNQYIHDFVSFTSAIKSGMITAAPYVAPPVMERIPTYHWLQAVYIQDTCERLEDNLAAITSVYGSILKVDSTKKVAKKLQGHSAGTASWATNVGNEYGQVLMSVLTTQEGSGLEDMMLGLQSRYEKAKVPAPKLLYVDRDCCTGRMRRLLQPHWSSTELRLDIWHFMRRLASAVTTESHPLYPSFMRGLSRAIFVWDEGDFLKLMEARRAQLQEEGFSHPSDSDVLKRISRKDMALHCRRTTRGTEETKRLIKELLDVYTSEQAKDTLGVPVLNNDQAWQIWSEQERHIPCIQDPPNVGLYIQTGTMTKGGVCLPTYRCARGSTSLENFHLHLNRFIPGNSTSHVHYQAYLVEGLMRWNQDRGAAAGVTGPHDQPRLYDGKLMQSIKEGSEKVDCPMFSWFKAPRAYTGEKIGYEYLLGQNSSSLMMKLDAVTRQDLDLTSEMVQEDMPDEGFEEDTGVDLDVDQTVFTKHEELVDRAFMEQSRPSTSVSGRPSTSQSETGRLSTSQTEAGRPSTSQTEAGRPSTSQTKRPSTSQTEVGRLSTSQTERPSTSQTEVGRLSTSQTERPSTSHAHTSLLTAHPKESVGPDSAPGFDRVEALVTLLLPLRTKMAVSNMEAQEIIQAYNCLDDYDKRPLQLAERFQTKVRGRFKAKGKTASPGVVATQRCHLSSSQGPATRVDCSRIVETLVRKLCALHPSAVVVEGKRIERWAFILRDYAHIRSAVLNNPPLLDNTTLQLPDINLATLRDWNNKEVKANELKVLQQGLPEQSHAMTAEQPVHPAIPLASRPDVGDAGGQHTFHLPPCRAQTATTRQRRIEPAPARYAFILPAPVPARTTPLQTVPVQPVVPGTTSAAPLPPSGPRPVPKSTAAYRKRRQKMKDAGEPVRIYKRSGDVFTCRKCEKPRLPVVDGQLAHTQIKGAWWCRQEDIPLQEWTEQRLAALAARKRQQPQESSSAPKRSRIPPSATVTSSDVADTAALPRLPPHLPPSATVTSGDTADTAALPRLPPRLPPSATVTSGDTADTAALPRLPPRLPPSATVTSGDVAYTAALPRLPPSATVTSSDVAEPAKLPDT